MIWIVAISVVVCLLCLLVALPRLVVRNHSPGLLASVSDPKDRIQLENDRTKLRNEFRSTCVQVLGGAAVLVGVLVTYRQANASQEALLRQAETTRSDAVEQRINASVSALGAQDVSQRLAAVSNLAALAEELPEDRQLVIGAILTSFVNNHSPLPPPPEYPLEMPLEELPLLGFRAPDVNEAIVRLGRGVLSEKVPSILTGDLRLADFRDGRFDWADIRNAEAQGSYFDNADLRSAYMWNVNLTGASFAGARLCGANMAQTVLEGVVLTNAVIDDQTQFPVGHDVSTAGVRTASDPEACTL